MKTYQVTDDASEGTCVNVHAETAQEALYSYIRSALADPSSYNQHEDGADSKFTVYVYSEGHFDILAKGLIDFDSDSETPETPEPYLVGTAVRHCNPDLDLFYGLGIIRKNATPGNYVVEWDGAVLGLRITSIGHDNVAAQGVWECECGECDKVFEFVHHSLLSDSAFRHAHVADADFYHQRERQTDGALICCGPLHVASFEEIALTEADSND